LIGAHRQGRRPINVQTFALAGRGLRSASWSVLVALLALCWAPQAALGQVPAETAASLGQAPPEWEKNASAWPSHNYDLANTRATTRTPINSRNVSRLAAKWRFPLGPTSHFFGPFASNPIAVDGTIYLQDLNSNVFALDPDSGQVKWQRSFDSRSVGPNGVAYGWGLVFGATASSAFALDAVTGAMVWSRPLIRNDGEGLDIAPQLYDNTVVVSTVPVNANQAYSGGAMGIVWALDARTGEPKWQFNTVKDGDLWGHPEINSGGGLWYPPAVDKQGRVFLAVANPAPFGGTPEFPNGSSRPGPNLYTNSLVAVDGKTGELLWYQQAVPHDVRDYDLEASPIISHASIGGVKTEIVIVAGKMGRVYAYRADDGLPMWELPVGTHQNDIGPLPDEAVMVFPGLFGGVETPMALSDRRLFVPWLDLGSMMKSTGFPAFPNLAQGRGGLTAVDPATGEVIWERRLPQMVLGAATVANDVVFTSTYDGTVYALDAGSGETLWTTTARAGINSFPAIDGDKLLVGFSARGFFQQPVFELIAYELE
jgi:alcohol dehydrogenase (cytochrome c)